MKDVVMKVQMFGITIVVCNKPGTDYPFRVYELQGLRNPYHLESFESFQEAAEFAIGCLYT